MACLKSPMQTGETELSLLLEGDMFSDEPVPLEAQIACVEREIGFRLSVYERRVAANKMSLALAQREIRAMKAVKKTLEELHARHKS